MIGCSTPVDIYSDHENSFEVNYDIEFGPVLEDNDENSSEAESGMIRHVDLVSRSSSHLIAGNTKSILKSKSSDLENGTENDPLKRERVVSWCSTTIDHELLPKIKPVYPLFVAPIRNSQLANSATSMVLGFDPVAFAKTSSIPMVHSLETEDSLET
eukprot:GHVH01001842.1.p1 GENE.GHVH01001842.1~~GHVH01001842.1.p1  ORF type:complete len:157 (-),score=20.16 GHVH01001842.1:785-1255(-)